MLKEKDIVDANHNYFFRTALKSNCPKAIGYVVAMDRDDWLMNIEHAHPDTEELGCIQAAEDENILECLFRLSPEHPVTGWQLKKGAHGVHWAFKVDLN